MAEARQLVAEGVRELNLISQDTTFFGMDTWEERPNPRTPVDSSRGAALTTLLRELQAIEGDFWIRLLYTHPAHWSDELIRTIAECPKVARYVDMPLQHISDRMLETMQRETDGALHPRPRSAASAPAYPASRCARPSSSGFPGETEADVDELCAFIRETKFERLGVFRYSQEEGTRAARLPGQVPAQEKDAPLAPPHGAAAGHRRRGQPRQRRAARSGCWSRSPGSPAARPTPPISTAASISRATCPWANSPRCHHRLRGL